MWWLTAPGRDKHRHDQWRQDGTRLPLVIESYATDRAFQDAAASLAALGYVIKSQPTGKGRSGWWHVTYNYQPAP